VVFHEEKIECEIQNRSNPTNDPRKSSETSAALFDLYSILAYLKTILSFRGKYFEQMFLQTWTKGSRVMLAVASHRFLSAELQFPRSEFSVGFVLDNLAVEEIYL
jgi:hypothetical protein